MHVILLFGKGQSTVQKSVELAACLVQWRIGFVSSFLVCC